MKRSLLMSVVGGAVLAGLFSVSASAQTCAAPTPWQPDATGAPPLSGSTCGAETGLTQYCSSSGDLPDTAFVASINVAAEGTFTALDFTGGAGYTLTAYVVAQSAGCVDNFTCTTSGDADANILHDDIAPGQYFLIISGADFDPNGACGDFTVTADGSLPVSLQDFTIS